MVTDELRERVEPCSPMAVSLSDDTPDTLIGQLERQQQTISALEEKSHRLEEELRVCKNELAMIINVLCQKDVDRRSLDHALSTRCQKSY